MQSIDKSVNSKLTVDFQKLSAEDLLGNYTFTNSSHFTNNKLTFVIARRKNPDPKKPELYLINKDYNTYISSIYDTDIENNYNIDYQGKRLKLFMSDCTGEVIISRR